MTAGIDKIAPRTDVHFFYPTAVGNQLVAQAEALPRRNNISGATLKEITAYEHNAHVTDEQTDCRFFAKTPATARREACAKGTPYAGSVLSKRSQVTSGAPSNVKSPLSLSSLRSTCGSV